MTSHDLVIVGSGSGNSIADEAFSQSSVAIVDGGTFGGTCLNVGCIPTKMFVYPGRRDLPDPRRRQCPRAPRQPADGRLAGHPGPDLHPGRLDLGRRQGVAPGPVQPTPRCTTSRPSWCRAKTLRLADGTEITADSLVLAAGSRPVLPEIAGLNEADVNDPMIPVHTSDTIMRLRPAARSGWWSSARATSRRSSRTSSPPTASRSPRSPGPVLLLRHFDHDIATGFTERAGTYWRVLTETQHGDGPRELHECRGGRVRPRTASRARWPRTRCSSPPVARPNSDTLGLARAGYDLEPDGRLSVDTYQRALSGGRPVAGVFGLGDLSSPFQLKHVANHEAKVVRHNLLDPSQLWESDHRFVPAVVFSHPQVAAVGLTEEQARETGRPVVTATHPYAAVAFGWAMAQDEETGGFAKVIADAETGDLLGAHILGAQASLLIQPIVTAMSFGIPARTMARGQYWPHPALSEVVENALLSLPLSAGAR